MSAGALSGVPSREGSGAKTPWQGNSGLRDPRHAADGQRLVMPDGGTSPSSKGWYALILTARWRSRHPDAGHLLRPGRHTLPHGVGRGLGAVSAAGLGENVADMRRHGVEADRQHRRDVGITTPDGDQTQ